MLGCAYTAYDFFNQTNDSEVPRTDSAFEIGLISRAVYRLRFKSCKSCVKLDILSRRSFKSLLYLFIFVYNCLYLFIFVYTQIGKELKITPILDKLLEYKKNWMQHVNIMPRNRLPRVMKRYFPTGRRNHGRLLKRLLDT
jgi:hypothetical protein